MLAMEGRDDIDVEALAGRTIGRGGEASMMRRMMGF